MERCPLKVDTSSFYPDNTCSCNWNYCMHLGDYNDCDVYKRHLIMTKKIVEDVTK